MNSLINPKVLNILGVLKQGALSILSRHKTDIPTKTIPENSFQKMQSAFVEKYEMGSGKNKINVRIFKEPNSESTNIKP